MEITIKKTVKAQCLKCKYDDYEESIYNIEDLRQGADDLSCPQCYGTDFKLILEERKDKSGFK